MQKVQHETGKVLNIGVVNRFNDSVNLIKKYIDDGKLGDVYHVYASFRARPRSIPGLGGAFTTKEIAGGARADRLGRPLSRHRHVLLRGDPKGQDRARAKCSASSAVDMKGYAYKDMWAGPPKYDGVYGR